MDSSYFYTSCAAAITLLYTLSGTIYFTFCKKSRFHHQDNKIIAVASPPPHPPLSTLSRNWRHDVFPSFHGPEVRKTFLSHVLPAFRRKGISPFIDNDIDRSKSIGPELKEAIRGSRIAIVLLSKNYASSSWCLNELVEIMKCREVLGQTVMPIFYEVDPTDVRKQTGDFGKAFRKTCRGKTKEETETWKKVLEDVATIAGYHSIKWNNEADMIEKIATDVSDMLNKSTPSPDFDRFVGMEAHMENMKLLLRLDLEDEVRMIGIWGPAGIGKSTIARVLFNQVSHSFQVRAIMVNIRQNYPRPCLDEGTAQLQLQNQMLSQMIDQKDTVINHIGVAQERLKDKKVFLVLDDVDRLGQLDALAKETRWFGPGSRIIITTEDLKLLEAQGINRIYKVNLPSTIEALQMFCMYAFDQKSPKYGFKKLAHQVTYLAGALPLGLKVMGSYFRGMSKQEWKKALPKLWSSLDGEIESVLKFSYDALCDESKDLFLHIACLFDDHEVERVEEHLANHFSDVAHGIQVLYEKSLISISSAGYIKMHDLLAELGRKIVRKQCVREPWQRLYMVNTRDICEVLSDDTKLGSKNVLGIKLGAYDIKEKFNMSKKAFDGMSNLQFIRFHDLLADHSMMYSLQGLDHQFQKLRLLDWDCFPLTDLTCIGNTKFLIELNMRESKLEKLWEGIQPLRNLTWVNLSGSRNLKKLPDLSDATNLRELNLIGCSSLVELPFSVGNAINLEKLILFCCSSLAKLPSSIGNFHNLRELDLRECSNLVELPFSVENATNLQKLDLSGCSSLLKLPSSIGNFHNISKLNLSGCSSLVELPYSVGNVTNLQKLDLSGCSSLVKLPTSIGNFHDLKKLNLSGCSGLVKLPSCIGNITTLQKLNLSHCSSLLELPSYVGDFHRLRVLEMQGCSKLEVLPTNINLESLNILYLSDCLLLKSFPEISTNIEHLFLNGTPIEEVPSSIRLWPHLKDLHMMYNENLKKFPHALDSITGLHFTDTKVQEVPPWIERISRLQVLVLNGCKKLLSLPKLPASLSVIEAENCESLERLDCSFPNPCNNLNFSKCFKLNQEARDLIIQTSTREVTIFPGGEVPACFTYKASGNILKVKLNQKPLCKSIKFRACILLENQDESDYASVECSFKSNQNDLNACTKNPILLDPLLVEHLYTFDAEAEEVTTTELVFVFELRFQTVNNTLKIKECGILEVPSCQSTL